MAAIAANLANVDSVTKPGEQPYRAHELVFQAAQSANGDDGDTDDTDAPAPGVQVVDTVQSNAQPARSYDPGNP